MVMTLRAGLAQARNLGYFVRGSCPFGIILV